MTIIAHPLESMNPNPGAVQQQRTNNSGPPHTCGCANCGEVAMLRVLPEIAAPPARRLHIQPAARVFGEVVGPHGPNAAAHDAAGVHKGPLLAGNQARGDGKHDADELGEKGAHGEQACVERVNE